jgi:prepilin-type N-terminal cleavage/methylation domain-containing protein
VRSPAGRVNTGEQTGFTLLEVVCVLAIIALLAAIALPSIPRDTSLSGIEAYALETPQPELVATRTRQSLDQGSACQFLGFRQTAHRRTPTSSASKTSGKRIGLSTVDARICAVDAVNAEPDPERK